jgi:hypothetical protein
MPNVQQMVPILRASARGRAGATNAGHVPRDRLAPSAALWQSPVYVGNSIAQIMSARVSRISDELLSYKYSAYFFINKEYPRC